jgi:hypothetical protein
MSRPPIPTATVAMIANAIIDRKWSAGKLDNTDFSEYRIPGPDGLYGKKTYKQRTLEQAAAEAWELCQAVENMRPQD